MEIIRAVEGRLAGLNLRANIRDIIGAVQAGASSIEGVVDWLLEKRLAEPSVRNNRPAAVARLERSSSEPGGGAGGATGAAASSMAHGGAGAGAGSRTGASSGATVTEIGGIPIASGGATVFDVGPSPAAPPSSPSSAPPGLPPKGMSTKAKAGPAQGVTVSEAALSTAIRVRAQEDSWRDVALAFVNPPTAATSNVEAAVDALGGALRSFPRPDSTTAPKSLLSANNSIVQDTALVLEVLRKVGSEPSGEAEASRVLSILDAYEARCQAVFRASKASSGASGRNKAAVAGARAMAKASGAPFARRAQHELSQRMEDATAAQVTASKEAAAVRQEKSRVDTEIGNLTRAATTTKESTDSPASLVGKRVGIKWVTPQGRRVWYSGTVGAWNQTDRKHRVDYDDGDVKWYGNLTSKAERTVEVQIHSDVDSAREGVDISKVLDMALSDKRGAELMAKRAALQRDVDALPSVQKAVTARIAVLNVLKDRVLPLLQPQAPPVNGATSFVDELLQHTAALRTAIQRFMSVESSIQEKATETEILYRSQLGERAGYVARQPLVSLCTTAPDKPSCTGLADSALGIDISRVDPSEWPRRAASEAAARRASEARVQHLQWSCVATYHACVVDMDEVVRDSFTGAISALGEEDLKAMLSMASDGRVILPEAGAGSPRLPPRKVALKPSTKLPPRTKPPSRTASSGGTKATQKRGRDTDEEKSAGDGEAFLEELMAQVPVGGVATSRAKSSGTAGSGAAGAGAAVSHAGSSGGAGLPDPPRGMGSASLPHARAAPPLPPPPPAAAPSGFAAGAAGGAPAPAARGSGDVSAMDDAPAPPAPPAPAAPEDDEDARAGAPPKKKVPGWFTWLFS